MKLSLKVKLTLSYVLIALFLSFALLFSSKYLVKTQFQSYIKRNLEKNAHAIVNQLTASFGEDGTAPSKELLRSIDRLALSKGFTMRVDMGQKMLWCSDPQICDSMLTDRMHSMQQFDPSFEGAYQESAYDLTREGEVVGKAILGYYGPFFYDNTDLQFLSMLDQIFFYGAVASLLVSLAIGWFMAARISAPIREVIGQADRIRHGKYGERIALTTGTTEVDSLIQSVNALAADLDRQLALRTRLAKDYAHELRTPLAALRSNLEAMIDGIWQPDKARLESLNEEVQRLTRMLSGIEELVQAEEETLVLHLSEFDLYELAEKQMLAFQPHFLQQQLHARLHGGAALLLADRDKIGQVLVNLLSNAVKYTPEGGSIALTVTDSPQNVELTVTDTGIGIGSQDLPNIFEHLYRADQSRSSSTGGSGVGLAVTKAIVEAHGGSIAVQSSPSQGSSFTVTIPKKR